MTTLLCSDGSLSLAFSDVQILSKVGFTPKASFADVNQGSEAYEKMHASRAPRAPPSAIIFLFVRTGELRIRVH
jgi:hypothetical protein